MAARAVFAVARPGQLAIRQLGLGTAKRPQFNEIRDVSEVSACVDANQHLLAFTLLGRVMQRRYIPMVPVPCWRKWCSAQGCQLCERFRTIS
jgi:hypothetical protein